MGTRDLDWWLKRMVLAAIPLELFWIGFALAPDAPATAGTRTTTLGPVALTHGPEWSPAVGGAGLDHRDGSRLRVVDGAPAPDAARRVRIGERPALLAKSGATATYVFTRRDGSRVSVTCRDATRAGACEQLAGTFAVDDAVEPAPRPAVGTRLRAAITRLNKAAAGSGLGADRLRSRAGAARRLAAAHRGLAGAGRRLAADVNTPATERAALRDLHDAATRSARALTALAAAARRSDRRDWADAAPRARRAQAAVRAAVEALAGHGYAIERPERA
jgi:hypothetical protein